MRPGPEGPGCRSMVRRNMASFLSFNEAGAGRPRMQGMIWSRGFSRFASMRPGPEGPGCDAFILSAPEVLSGFNEAGAGRPRMPPGRSGGKPARDSASMRPGPEGPGCPVNVRVRRVETNASMRPGPEGPGCGTQLSCSIRFTPASMRPGPEGPGCTDIQRATRFVHIRFNEAGAGRPRMQGESLIKSVTQAALQ